MDMDRQHNYMINYVYCGCKKMKKIKKKHEGSNSIWGLAEISFDFQPTNSTFLV